MSAHLRAARRALHVTRPGLHTLGHLLAWVHADLAPDVAFHQWASRQPGADRRGMNRLAARLEREGLIVVVTRSPRVTFSVPTSPAGERADRYIPPNPPRAPAPGTNGSAPRSEDAAVSA